MKQSLNRQFKSDMIDAFVYDDLLITQDRGRIAFLNRNSANFSPVLLPKEYGLSDPVLSRERLVPVPTGAVFTNKIDNTQIDGNTLLVKGLCSEIYIYNIKSLLNRNWDRQLCQESVSSSHISGRNITVSSPSCKVKIDGEIEIVATNSIKLKAGTKIKKGSIFIAKIKPKHNCKLKGGIVVNSSNGKSSKFKPSSKSHVSISNQEPLIKLDDKKKDLGISIYPNPTNGILLLKSHLGLKVNSIIISNLSGINISSLSYNRKTEIELDLTKLLKGVYILQIYTEGGKLITEKIIKH